LQAVSNQLHQLSEAQKLSTDQLQQEITLVRENIREVKDILNQFKVVSADRSRRKGLFSRRRSSIPVQVEPETKSPIRLEELLPLLPQLSGMIPQLNNPKVAETIKILSNPAVVSMIQQFMSNGGLKMKTEVPQQRWRA
jgi:hypothetical protein